MFNPYIDFESITLNTYNEIANIVRSVYVTDMAPMTNVIPVDASYLILSQDESMMFTRGLKRQSINFYEISVKDLDDLKLSYLDDDGIQRSLYGYDFKLSQDNNIVYTKSRYIDELYVYNIHDFTNPQLLGSYEMSFPFRTENMHLSADETKAFAFGRHSAGIIDISDPTNMYEISKMDFEFIDDIDVAEKSNMIVVADNKGLSIMDIADAYNPTLVNTFKIENAEYNGKEPTYYTVKLSTDEKTLYVEEHNSVWMDKTSFYYTQLNIIDISEPTNPKMIGRFNTGRFNITRFDFTWELILSDDENRLYMIGDYGLKIIDITNKKYPVELTDIEHTTSSYGGQLSKDGTKLYIY